MALAGTRGADGGFDVAVIGGGFYGMYLASHFARKGRSVVIIEERDAFMGRASYVNQARVHQGYHYPRSVLTALRSRVSFPRFVAEFPRCVVSSFEKYYLIGKVLGKVTARQFERFCLRIGAHCEPAPHRLTRHLNPSLVEASFSTVEYAFDSVELKRDMEERLNSSRVSARLGTRVSSVTPAGDGLVLSLAGPGEDPEVWETITARQVFNCTYSRLNSVLAGSSLPLIPLKHELTELCLVEVPDEVRGMGITVMCGPFFSCMPFPSTPYHSFSHVRYTPHATWYEGADGPKGEPPSGPRRSAWGAMRADARRYMPILGEACYKESLWEVKTVLPSSEVDDSRPILFRRDQGARGFHCVMGGKIDNVYDVVDAIEREGL